MRRTGTTAWSLGIGKVKGVEGRSIGGQGEDETDEG